MITRAEYFSLAPYSSFEAFDLKHFGAVEVLGNHCLHAALRGWWIACFKSCRSNSTSDGVSIRGVFEVTSFRPGKFVEPVSDFLSPPVFKFLSMFHQ